MVDKFDNLVKLLCNLSLKTSVFLFVVIVLMNSINLLLRWLLNAHIESALEISLILIIYSVMLIIPVLFHDKKFIQMRLIEEIISEKQAAYLNLIVDVFISAFFIYLLPQAISLGAGQIHTISGGIGIPRAIVTLPLVIGAMVSIAVGISSIIHNIEGLRSS